MALPEVSQICLLLEGGATPPLQSTKIKTRVINRRPNYSDFFDWANSEIQSTDDISVICNSDISLDSSIEELARNLRPHQCAALSRWDEQPDGSACLFDRNDSQDTWVFRGPIRSLICDYPMGIPRCDNRILYELQAAGYEVINPAFSIKTVHLHAGQREEYPHEIDGLCVDPPYAYRWPHNLLSLPKTAFINVMHPSKRVGWRLDYRRLAASLPARIFKRFMRTLFRARTHSS